MVHVRAASLEGGDGGVDAHDAPGSPERGGHAERARVREQIRDAGPCSHLAHAPPVRPLIEEKARGEPVSQTNEERHRLLDDRHLLGRGSAPDGQPGREVFAARVGQDIGLLRPDLQVHAVESERVQPIEQAFPRDGLRPGVRVASPPLVRLVGRAGIELSDEPAPVDVDRQAWEAVAVLVDEAKRRRGPGASLAPAQPPSPLEGAIERARERAFVPVDGVAGRRAIEPGLEFGRKRRLKAHRLSRRRVLEPEGGGVQHHPRGRDAAVGRIARDRRPRMGELHTGLMRPTRLELELEHRALPPAREQPHPGHGLHGALVPRRGHAHPAVAVGRQGVAQGVALALRGPPGDARDVRLAYRPPLELRRKRPRSPRAGARRRGRRSCHGRAAGGRRGTRRPRLTGPRESA